MNDWRLALFDIDGTLVDGDGVGGRVMRRVFHEVYGTVGPADTYDYAGKTDPQIVRELMTQAGLQKEIIEAKQETFFQVYTDQLERALRESGIIRVHPGVLALLQVLETNDHVQLGLLTGNIKSGADLKLRATQLDRFFSFGVYGCDSADRRELPRLAMERGKEQFERMISPQELVVIGDTPLDIECGKAGGTKTIAVATGYHSVEQLRQYQPDHIFSSFLDANAVTQAILS